MKRQRLNTYVFSPITGIKLDGRKFGHHAALFHFDLQAIALVLARMEDLLERDRIPPQLPVLRDLYRQIEARLGFSVLNPPITNAVHTNPHDDILWLVPGKIPQFAQLCRQALFLPYFLQDTITQHRMRRNSYRHDLNN